MARPIACKSARWLKRFAEKASKATRRGSTVRSIPAPARTLLLRLRAAGIAGHRRWSRRACRQSDCPSLSPADARQRRESKPLAATRARPPSAVARTPAQLTQRLVLRMMDAPLPAVSAESRVCARRVRHWCWETTLWPARSPPGFRRWECRSKSSLPVIPGRTVQRAIRTVLDPAAGSPFVSRPRPHDPEARLAAGEAAWQRRYERGILTPFFLCQQWLTRLEDARLCDGATLVATTALGADFGFSGNLGTVEGGAATGLVKSLFIESRYEKWAGLRFKVLDFHGDEPIGAAAEAVFQELAAASPTSKSAIARAAAAWCGRLSNRSRRRSPRRCRAALGWLPAEVAESRRSPPWHSPGASTCELHLVGLSPQPDIDPSWRGLSPSGLEQLKHSIFRQAHAAGRPPHEEWRRVEKALEIDRTLRACAAAGVATTYHSCDVSVWEDLDRVLRADSRCRRPDRRRAARSGSCP